jgi:hypothetical protein
MRSKNKVLALFMCVSLAPLCWAGSQSKGLLVYVSLNPASTEAELREIEKIARAKKLKLITYSDIDTFYEDLKESKSILYGSETKSLFLSGHSDGRNFFEGLKKLNYNELGQILERAPRNPLGSVENVHLLGCFTGCPANVLRWAETFPKAKKIYGFDGKAPSPSNEAIKNTDVSFQDGNKDNGNILIDRNKLKSKEGTVAFETSKRFSKNECNQKLDQIKESLAPFYAQKPQNLFKDLDEKFQAVPNKESPQKIAFTGTLSKEFLKAFTDMNDRIQRELRLCEDSFFIQPEVRAFFDDPGMTDEDSLDAPIKRLIILRHSNTIAKNFLTCAQPGIETLKTKAEKCGAPNKDVVLAKLRSISGESNDQEKIGLFMESLFSMEKAQNGDTQFMRKSLLLNFVRPWNNSEAFPIEACDPIDKPSHKLCEGVKEVFSMIEVDTLNCKINLRKGDDPRDAFFGLSDFVPVH